MRVLNIRGTHVAGFLAVLALSVSACSKSEEAVSEETPIAEVVDEAGMAAGEDVEPFEAASGPSYLGVWAADAAWCAAAPGASDASPIVITESEFIGYENLCRIANIEDILDDAWRMELVCEAEGVEYVESINLKVASGALTLSREDSSETVFQRCE